MAREARFEGPGLFNPDRARVAVCPAPGGHGLVFERTDLPGKPRIPAIAERTVARERQTVLAAAGAQPGASVQTVEHLLSALTGLGITDARIEIAGPEVPLLDGSAGPFAAGLVSAGIVDAPGDTPEQRWRSAVVVEEPVTLQDRLSTIQALPLEADAQGPRLVIEYHLHYGPAYPQLRGVFRYTHRWAQPDAQAYTRDLAPARTFCTDQEAQAFRQAGAFAHLDASSVLVLAPEGPVGSALRFDDEPARHKALDVLGDLALAARPVHARVLATRSGHNLNQQLAARLAALPEPGRAYV